MNPLERVTAFQNEIKQQGIHMGMATNGVVRCVTCHEVWPCKQKEGNGA